MMKERAVENNGIEMAELRAEVNRLRGYVAELEDRLRRLAGEGSSAEEVSAANRQPRMPLDARIEFIGDFDVARARGIDLSDGGVCFEVEDDLPFEMRFKIDGKEQMRRARGVWMRRKPEGGYLLGLQFIDPEPGESF